MNNDSPNDSPNVPDDDHHYLPVPDEELTPLAKRFLWVESTSKLSLAILALASLCLVLFVLDFIVHRHAYAPYEGTPGFYSLTGFLAFSFIVLGSSALRWIIARSEGFYSPNSVDEEVYPEEGLQRQQYAEGKSESESDS